ncbi:MAG: hypothetical protein ACKVIH_01575 [Burkholderiales bacterium]
MNTNLHQYVLAQLNHTPGRPKWAQVARETGVPYETLKKIASLRTPNPGICHVQTLADYFVARQVSQPAAGQGAAQIDAAVAADPLSFERRDPGRINQYPDLERRAQPEPPLAAKEAA